MASISIPLDEIRGESKPKVDFEVPSFSVVMKEVDREERYSAARFSRLEHWIKALQPFTFETSIIPLPREQAQSILKANDAGKLELLFQEQEYREKHPDAKIFGGRHKFPEILHLLGKEERKHLKQLEERLDIEIKKMGPGGAFVRTSGMSPKDAFLSCLKVREQVRESVLGHLERFPHATQEEQEEYDATEWMKLSVSIGRVTSGKEALYFLYSSNRTYSDISGTFLQNEEGVELIIRKWEEIDPGWEFRAFLVHNKITTIQTYAGSYSYSKKIVENKLKIRDMIESFFEEKVKHVVAKLDPAPPSIYTMDFYVSPSLDHVGIIEINEGPPIAGTDLYSLKNEEDVKLIEGRAGLERADIRVQMEPVRWGSWVHSHIRFLVDELRGRDTSWVESDPHW
eukprot:CAMPEP_0201476592 /NCGR_PEP_ID=MMETSP0151_2-20130828/1772_1 /ASSEMBLY_ACC=CAM_ASM_000257 /TAXON_ID=200890 /ORGANISM="Paramoeba atlantica, Strain 621/1 / CCAP 1560/9" /LENGTH=398 /DNA_ID=CAMNT_0047857007 /DNA_START=43 /DNA_END=1236 /DNA_ORIENTATION=+